MKVIFETYAPDENIPISNYLKNRKLAKYFNRETAAAMVSVSKLLADVALAPDTPFYYAAGLLEYEAYGLPAIARASINDHG